jgi:hypothetical protein
MLGRVVEAKAGLDYKEKILDLTGKRTPTPRSLGLQKLAVLTSLSPAASYNTYHANFSLQVDIMADGILKSRWF